MNDRVRAENEAVDAAAVAAVRRLKQGDIGGLETLVRAYQVEAVRTAYLITHDLALADDVMQEAFLRVYQYIDQYDENRPFTPWFMRIVANLAITAVTRERQRSSLNGHFDQVSVDELLLHANSLDSHEARLESAELKQQVWDALAELSPEQRAVVVLKYYHDMSEREMADLLDVPQGTVGWRLHAARKRLGAHLRGVLKPVNRQEG